MSGIAPRAAGAVAAALLLFPARPARADEPVRLRFDWTQDLVATGSATVVAVIFPVALNAKLVPDQCRWCNPPGFDADVRGALKWKSPGTANTISNITGYAGAPLAAFGMNHLAASHDGRGAEAWENDLMIAEVGATGIVLNEISKPAFGRARPAVHFHGERESSFGPHDRNTSFYSGHTSFAFSVAVASGTLASMRRYRLAPAVWATGLVVASVTGYMRVAADAHYATDVLTGAAVGSAVGFAIPYFLHPPESGDQVAWLPALQPVPGGATAGVIGQL